MPVGGDSSVGVSSHIQVIQVSQEVVRRKIPLLEAAVFTAASSLKATPRFDPRLGCSAASNADFKGADLMDSRMRGNDE